jgi:hypothetical protein
MKISRFIAACFPGLTGATLTAQITTTTLLGAVTDKSGAVVVDGRVTATNAGTNQALRLMRQLQLGLRFAC